MSLHPGEKGVCPKHGEYDEFCDKCADARSDKRLSVSQQTPPKGNGEVVLDYVKLRLDNMITMARIPQALGPLCKPENLEALNEDLTKRAAMGLAKYGTYLRTNNGRAAIVDLYQEIADAIMYSGQCLLEGDKAGAAYFELLINIGSQIAGVLNSRA